MKIQIVIDFRRIQDNVGISTVLRSMLTSILNYNNKNFNFILLVNSRTQEIFNNLPPNIKVVEIKSKPFSFMENLEIPFFLYKNKIDLYHSTHFNLPLFMFLIKKTKVISNFYDLIPLHSTHFNVMKKIYFHIFFKSAYMQSNLLITISNKSKDDIINTFKATSEKVKVIYCCLNNNTHAEPKSNYLNDTKSQKITKLLFVGAHYEHKNILSIVKAMHILKQKGVNNVKLITAGNKPPYFEVIENEIKQLNLTDVVECLGPVSSEKLKELYHTSTLFLFPSLEEGFGLPPVEAMSYGLPVISSNRSVMPEIIGDAGILIDPSPENFAEKIELIINNENLRNSLIEKGFERTKIFSNDHFSTELFKCYDEVLELR